MEKKFVINKIDKILLSFVLIFILLWIFLFSISESPVLFEWGFFTFSLSGIFGLLAATTFGWYISKNFVYPEKSYDKHIWFSVFMAVYSLSGYIIGLTIYTIGSQILP